MTNLGDAPDAYVMPATPEIFTTLGVDIVSGRGFDARDDATAPRVVVISEQTARTIFGTRDALGRQLVIQVSLRPPSETYSVVGIARDTDTGEATKRRDNAIYVPLAQHFERNLAIKRMILGEGYRPVLQGLGVGLFLGVFVRLLLRA